MKKLAILLCALISSMCACTGEVRVHVTNEKTDSLSDSSVADSIPVDVKEIVGVVNDVELDNSYYFVYAKDSTWCEVNIKTFTMLQMTSGESPSYRCNWQAGNATHNRN